MLCFRTVYNLSLSINIPRLKISCVRLSQQHDHSKKQQLAATKKEPASKSLFARISNTNSATKHCRRRSRAPPSLTAKRAAWTYRTGTGCLPRRLAGPSSSSRKSIIFIKYWRRHFETRKGGREKQLMVCTVYTMRIVVKLGKYIFYPMSLLSFTYIFSCCDCQIIIQQLCRSVKYSILHEDRQRRTKLLLLCLWRTFTFTFTQITHE